MGAVQCRLDPLNAEPRARRLGLPGPRPGSVCLYLLDLDMDFWIWGKAQYKDEDEDKEGLQDCGCGV